jgi:hypothetical protein
MKNFKFANNLSGWITFVIAAVTYLLTIEPTASYWDCGEFISTAYKLDVGHPPGAPFFMLLGRFVANFASDPTFVARMINSLSAVFSGLTILFLFWSITHLARKIVPKDEKNMTTGEIITILGSGFVGALAYTFSDTFWFSAVEGEVYASSSLFTAVVFWAMLKWEDAADQPYSERWIIFIAYLMGLSIGVHLLNLLCIPALVLIYYFKKTSKITLKGSLLVLLGSVALIAVVLYGIVPGFVNMAGWFDLLFVNVLGFSFNTGAIFYVILMIGVIIWGLYETFRGKSELRMKVAFCSNIILVGIPFYGESPVLWVLLCGAVIVITFIWKGINQRLMNTMLLSLMVMLIGYSSYGVTVIRSNAQPPMDQDSPNNMFTLERYLNREQYGETPLLYGETFASDVAWKTEGNNCVPVYKKSGPIWNEKAKDAPDEKDKYVITGYNEKPEMVEECNMFFPRMYSRSPNDIEAYKMWSNFKGQTVTLDNCGQTQTVQKPTMIENLRYFFSYQVNFMYWRYFMWNFSGRQNDIQGHGEIQNGNWITGINAIDRLLVGDQSNLPSEMEHNKGHNKYYLLPLLLGILGIIYQTASGDRGIQGFWITFLLFFMTGLAIVLYLNQTPLQPRERDYAYAGSFYAFTIWIGLGVPFLVRAFKKFLPETPAAIVATLLCLYVPTLMASENWDDHDRSNRYTCRDFAYNYLASCDKNAVLFTNGDNDTFPLWYIQEVEGVRKDVRVCNLSYLQTDWYISQMRRPYYNSDALPISWTKDMYSNGKRDIGRIIKLTEDSISLDMAMQWIETDDQRYKHIPGYDEAVDFIPSNKIYMDINASQVLENKYLEAKYVDKIVPQLHINLGDKSYLGKQELMILEMLRENKWKRSIYYAVTVDEAQFLGLKGSFLQEGLAYKIAPIKSTTGQPTINTDKMYDMMINKFRWGNIQDPKVYLDENNLRMCRTNRAMFAILARALYEEGKADKVEKVLDYCQKVIPMTTVPCNYNNAEIGELYYRIGKPKKALAVMKYCAKISLEYLDWAYSLKPSQYASASELVRMNLYTMQVIASAMDTYDKGNSKPYIEAFQKHAQIYQQFSEMKNAGSQAN